MLSEEQLKYKPYHDLFKIILLPLIILLYGWISFFSQSKSDILSFLLGIIGIYSIITFFILPIKYLSYRKFFIDIVFLTFLFLLFIHFSGGAESPFFPLLFCQLLPVFPARVFLHFLLS